MEGTHACGVACVLAGKAVICPPAAQRPCDQRPYHCPSAEIVLRLHRHASAFLHGLHGTCNSSSTPTVGICNSGEPWQRDTVFALTC